MQSRRQFLRTGLAGAASVLVPGPAVALARHSRRPRLRRFRTGTFPQGVLSGDPAPDGITLLTILGGVGGYGTVRLEVARDHHFRHVVAREDLATGDGLGFSAKARVEGLKPHTRYWYRFETRQTYSPVGRFQTALPPDSRETVRFATFSCADYTNGFYNAYAAMARDDLDFVVCLGDYVYAETTHSLARGDAVRDDLIGIDDPPRPGVLCEAVTLDEYRAKYALYRTDPALQRMHAKFPMVAVWDDHELENNYAGRPADGGLALEKRYSGDRKAASYQAFFESMPLIPKTGDRIYRAARHGRSVELVMLDERGYRDDQPCGDRRKQACAAWGRRRNFLGRRQLDWVGDRLTGSGAAWKVVGSQSMMMPLLFSDGRYNRYDAWQGYPVERETLLARIADSGTRDVVFMAGDAHTFFAGDVRRQMGAGPSVGVEFVSGSISSAGMGEHDVDLGDGHISPGNREDPHTAPEFVDALRGYNPWITQADLDHHGYVRVEASPRTYDVTMRRVQTVRRPSRIVLPPDEFHWTLERGQRSLGGRAG